MINTDLSFQIVAERISSAYMDFIKREIMPRLDNFPTQSIRELRVLVCIHLSGGDITSAEIADILMFDRATVSRSTKKLIRDGYIVPHPDAYDTRMIRMQTTERGNHVGSQYVTFTKMAFNEIDETTEHSLNAVERGALLSAMDTISKRALAAQSLKLRDHLFQASGPQEKA